MTTQPSLLPSLQTLSQSLTHLSSSLTHLETCTHDLPRLSRVLSLTPHFALLPASRLSSAQEKLASEIEPEISTLLQKVEEAVQRREGRGEWLRARWELYEGRLGRESAQTDTQNEEQSKKKQKNEREDLERKMQATRLRQKKERLSYAVERLTLQAQQRERQLRMSVAAQGVRVDEDPADEGDSGF